MVAGRLGTYDAGISGILLQVAVEDYELDEIIRFSPPTSPTASGPWSDICSLAAAPARSSTALDSLAQCIAYTAARHRIPLSAV